MANIPGGAGVNPGVFTDVITQSRGVSIPGGSRIAAMIGEGSTDETLVSQASGGGQDGLNSSYTGTTGRDGRHFQITNVPLISNRTTLFKNGIPLVGLESLIDANPFNNKYDYRVDITTGRIELQRAHFVDQGNSSLSNASVPYYLPLSTNVGVGSLTNLTLLDLNAPPETWTIRCSSVQRDSLNAPIALTAKFLAFGSISGAKLDANGNPVIWKADGYVVSNGVLSFAIVESTPVFREGDAFTIKVVSGVLVRNDSLVVNYIPTFNLNDPVLLQGLGPVANRHGFPSLTNNLSLGAQLAFANSAPALLTVQAAPPMPRRSSYFLDSDVNALALDNDEFIFPLPVGVTPDFNSQIHFFVTNNATNVETQILPNKLDYYLLDTSGQPTTTQFITDNTAAPGGHSYFYTVKQSLETLNFGEDGYIARLSGINRGLFSSSVVFDSTYVGKTLKIIDSANSANYGLFHVTAVSGGKLDVIADATLVSGSTFHNPTYLSAILNQTSVSFQVIDPVTGLQVAANAGTNGALNTTGVGDGYMSSATIDFSAIVGITNYKLKINNGELVATSAQPVGNDGLYDIISTTGTGVNIRKAIVQESALEYEVLDPSDVSNYVVVNHNVVPNGYAIRVTLIDTKDAGFYDAGWINALESLEKVECDILVPLPKQTISVIFQNALAHCKSMSNIRNKKERVLFMGAISGLTPDNLTGVSDAAVEDIGILEGIQGETVTDILAGNVEDLANYSVSDAFGNTFRAVYFYPDQIVVQAGGDNVLIDGFYLAAAAAGFESADVRLENPLTNKVLSGFTILRDKQFSPLTLEQLSAAGVTTLQPVAGGGRIVWGRTTTQSGFPEEEEISIVFIRDRVAKVLRTGFGGFIGNAETPDTQAILNTRAIILLNSLVSQGLISQYADLSVARDGVDPRQWNIAVRVQPTYPVNFIYIKVSLGQI
jgi:hypothetical protein